MVDVILKNILGQDVTYTGIDTVKLKNTAGGEETFSHGIAVEDVPISLDLANGGTQTIYAPEGSLVKSAVISITGGGGGDAVEMEETELPFAEGSGAYQTLLPITRLFLNATYTVVWNGTEYTCTCKAMEFADSLILTLGNAVFLGGEATTEPFLIAQLPDMVGCITTEANATNTISVALNFDSGGSSVKTAGGTFKGNGGGYTLNHNLGVIPDIFIVYMSDGYTTPSGTEYIYSLVGLSSKAKALFNIEFGFWELKNSNTAINWSRASSATLDNGGSSNFFSNITETSIVIGNSSYGRTLTKEYSWFAIGGLS